MRATYPEILIETSTYAKIDSRLSYGHVAGPGVYSTTITQPELFRGYLIEQFGLLMRNHGVRSRSARRASRSRSISPFPTAIHVEGEVADRIERPLRDIFDVPDLAVTDDAIVNGTYDPALGDAAAAGALHGAAGRLFAAPAAALHRDRAGRIFQNFVHLHQLPVLRRRVRRPRPPADGAQASSGYESFVEPGNVVTPPRRERAGLAAFRSSRLPQMPAYHLTRPGHTGITMVNIGVGPSNAKTITDHIAVLRPHAWLMLGHCAGLGTRQELGDYVLAHGYVREDHVLDADLPTWVPIPPLAEVQVALEQAVEEVTGLSGFELKRIMRTGTVATIDNRNWELRDQREPVAALLAVAGDRARHGIGDDRRQRLPLPRALRHAALRVRQAAPWRVEAAGHGVGLLPAPGQPAPRDRHPRHGEAARDAAGAAAFAQAAELRRDGVPVARRCEATGWFVILRLSRSRDWPRTDARGRERCGSRKNPAHTRPPIWPNSQVRPRRQDRLRHRPRHGTGKPGEGCVGGSMGLHVGHKASTRSTESADGCLPRSKKATDPKRWSPRAEGGPGGGRARDRVCLAGSKCGRRPAIP